MIAEFIERFQGNKQKLRAIFSEKHPDEYKEIVQAVVCIISSNNDSEYFYGAPDKDNIHEINDGDYQGTLVYVIAEKGYQPSKYWYVRISYGSCSGCDTLEAIREYSQDSPTEQQIKDYMTLALHIVQGLKEMDGEIA